MALSEVVQNSVWEDAKNSFNSPSLVGPPTVEPAMYKRVPTGKPRKDGREGTIDQDEEFMAFLAELANPTTQKDGENGHGADDDGETKPTTTPLIEHIREKKANKAKEAANAKSSKHSRQESSGKGKTLASTDDSKKRSSKDKSDRPREKITIMKKQATESAVEAAKAVAKEITAGSSSEQPRSRRANIAVAARILERDLGISAGSAHRRARQEIAKADTSKKPDVDAKGKDTNGKDAASSSQATSSTAATATSTPPSAPKALAEKSAARGGRSRRGKDPESSKAKEAPAPTKVVPVILKRKEENPTSSTPAAPSTKSAPAQASTLAPPVGPKASLAKASQGAGSQKKGNSNPAPAAGGTRAFVKHANPSQGVTEALLKEAMQAFGSVTYVEIDRRKGFAYVDFTEHDGLVKAMAASPVSIAQATVQVLERKDGSAKKAGNPTAPAQTSGSSGQKENATGTSNTAPSTGPADKATAGPSGESNRRSRRRGGRGRDGGAKDGAANKSADQRPASSGGPPAAAGGASNSAG